MTRIQGLLAATRASFLDPQIQAFRSCRAEDLIPGQRSWFTIRDSSIASDIALMATSLRLLGRITGDATYDEQRKKLFGLLPRFPSQWKSAHGLLTELALDPGDPDAPMW
jgi:uncharacterized protein YyaL (SSP411 family)